MQFFDQILTGIVLNFLIMTSYFKTLFEYNHHHNRQLCEAFEVNAEKITEKATSLFNHILNAHQIWNNRINPVQPQFSGWVIHDPAELQEINQMNHAQTLDILKKFDLGQSLHYTNSRGESYTNEIRDILFHIINHSTYHRGQIAL